MGLGAVIVAVAVVAVLVWAGYLANNARRDPSPDPTPPNQQLFLSDDDLESSRLTRVLGVAVIVAAVLAITLPVYYLGESNRQAEAAHEFEEIDIHEGEKWYTNFSCIECHGADGGGGGASIAEPRSGISTSWSAPSLNDVFYRYSEDEVRYWIVFGRAGTPMPANGLEGGGGMTSQEVDQVIAYIRSLEIPQSEAVAKVESQVSQAINRVANGQDDLAARLADLEEERRRIADAPALFDRIGAAPDQIVSIMTSSHVCTDESAALFQRACDVEGPDDDRDGLSNEAESVLSALSADVAQAVGNDDLAITLDPGNAFTTFGAAGEPLADFDAVDQFTRDLDAIVLNLRVTTDRIDVFSAQVESQIAYLEAAAEDRAWEVDYDAIAAEAFGGDRAAAERAVGLFNAYCARCHTSGYAAGTAFQQEEGSGAWGPALDNGRTLVQFPSLDEHIDFIIKGSDNAVNFGVNGIGRGWMPGFGQILSRDDIALIVAYERTL